MGKLSDFRYPSQVQVFSGSGFIGAWYGAKDIRFDKKKL